MNDFYRPDLAYIHDAGFGAVAEHGAKLLLRELRARSFKEGTVVDLGCGSGILSAAAAARGFDAVGIDISPAMIALARKRAPNADFRVGPIEKAKLPPCVAVAAVGEILNYVFRPKEKRSRLPDLFRRIHHALAPGGLFLLDVAGPGRAGGAYRPRFVAGANWAVFAESHEEDGTFLARRIISFRQIEGGLYRKDEETHRQRLYAPSEIARPLRAAGFRVKRLAGYGSLKFPKGVAGFLATKP